MVNSNFWESLEQARERLRGSYVLYGDAPFYVEDVTASDRGMYIIGNNVRRGAREKKSADDPLFNMFRTLPPLGWCNLLSHPGLSITRPKAVYTTRVPNRGRSHGLVTNRIRIRGLVGGTWQREGFSFESVVCNPGYHEGISGIFPTMEETLENLQPSCTVAISKKFAINRDSDKLFWLYRNSEKLGLLGKQEIKLFPSNVCFREELSASSLISVSVGEL